MAEEPDLAFLRREVERLKTASSPLSAGAGGGTSGGMESRVAALEANVGHLQADVATMKTDVGALKIDVAVIKATMATKGFIVVVVVGTGAVLGAITAFAPFIQHLLGIKS